ncbi:2-phosphosulfolactate phosphatase [Neosynechococcus sphagnicola]|uniref:2-phosphosulfolactate phosphatase n=1 Tax=Neosynechococcus sphagnicola TaxID=1501145 RepID=UPI00308402A9
MTCGLQSVASEPESEGGVKVPGCDLGNSPLDCTPDRVQQRRLFISTTNGTRCLQRIQSAPTVLAAAFINRQAVVDFLAQHQPATVWLVGSGWEGSFSLEDTTCAGAIVHALRAHLDCPLASLAGNDEVINAYSLYSHWQHQLLEMFHHASHGQRLLGLDCLDDLKYCAQEDCIDTLPWQREPGVLVTHD